MYKKRWQGICITLLLVVLFPFHGISNTTQSRGMISIADAKLDVDNNYVPDRLGEPVTIAGRVTVGSGVLRTQKLFIALQDQSAGIFIYQPEYNGPKIHAGDSLRVTGVIDQYHGLTQLVHPVITFCETSHRQIPPAVSIRDGSYEKLEGRLVKVMGRIINKGVNDGGNYLLIAPGAGTNNTLFVFNAWRHRDTSLFDKYKAGEMVEITGLLSQFDSRGEPDGVYQLLPRSKADLQIVQYSPGYYSRLALLVGCIAIAILAFNLILQKRVRQRTRKLKASESRFAKLTETTTSAILIYQNGQFVYQNPVMASITTGGDLNRLLDQWTEELKKTGRTINAPSEFRYTSIDGQTFWFTYTSEPIAWNDRDALIITATNITQRKQTEEELRRSEERFQSMAQAATVGIFRTRPDGYTTYVNPKWSELSGLPLSQATGYGWMEAVHPDDRDWLLQRWSDDRESSHESVAEYRFLRPDGTVRWVLGDAVPEFDSRGELISFVGTITDITQQKQAQQEIRQSEEKYKYLFYQNPQPLLIYCTESLRFIEVNERAIRHYGYSREEFLNMTVEDIRPPEDAAAVRKAIKEQKTKYKDYGTWRHLKKNGEVIQVEIANHEIEYNGKPARIVLINDVTERLKAQQKLEESEKSLNTAQEIARMGDWEYDLVHNQTTWSDNNFRLFDLVPGETKPTFEYFINRVHPEDRKLVELANRKMMETHQPTDFDFRITDKNGQTIWLSNNIVPYFKDGQLIRLKGVNIDITERKQILERLKLLNTSIEQSPISIVITDPEGVIEFVNPNFTRKTGYLFNEAVGNTMRIIKSGAHTNQFYREMWETIKSGKVWNGEIQNRKKNGELFWDKVLISPVKDDHSQITHFVSIKEDITEKKRLFDELVEAKEKAEESNRLKSAFLANISHEIRTPMNSILGFSELLQSSDLSVEEKEEFFDIIEQSGKRMLKTITKIVEISRLDTNQVELVASTVPVNLMLRKLEQQFKTRASERQLVLSLEPGLPDEQALVHTDEEKLETVVRYLLNNAFKYTHRGSVRFGYRPNGKMLQFFVEDTGIGMNESACRKIFRPFVQTDGTYTRSYEGLGLGLVIAKGYVEKLGGKIELESEFKKGTTVTFTLPFRT
ncbi:PAS domain S-box protein [Prolixibacter denitrificans]|uniref:histidine kinase n=2 Tax=Prolixibacter denitrificans TaxID=1541063 RepID=A0A2P8CAR1_9BACT|nr:PAS domain S-box protein [Prolixibacter denitrificans]PSK82035.1 PAS domain S-box-containing protein [Prolixibacter denitrificans]